jgi:hypothetical protein
MNCVVILFTHPCRLSLVLSCRIGPNTKLEQGAAGGQPPSSLETNPFFE